MLRLQKRTRSILVSVITAISLFLCAGVGTTAQAQPRTIARGDSYEVRTPGERFEAIVMRFLLRAIQALSDDMIGPRP